MESYYDKEVLRAASPKTIHEALTNKERLYEFGLIKFVLKILPFCPYPYLGSYESCDLCGGRSAKAVSTIDRNLKHLNMVCCTGCGLIRTDPMPTEDELEIYYRRQYRQDQLATVRPPRAHLARSSKEAMQRSALLSPVLQRRCEVLDFGSGSGEFLKLLAANGHCVTGIEPGELYASFSVREYGLKVFSGSYADIDFPEKSFDLITAHHVIEHLRQPIDALRRMAAWLKDDGVIYISVPDITRSSKPTFERFHFDHVHNFAPETLQLAAVKAGLEPDLRFAPNGTTQIFGKTKSEITWNADPALPDRILASLPPVSVTGHVLSGAWLKPMLKRARKYLRDHQAFTHKS